MAPDRGANGRDSQDGQRTPDFADEAQSSEQDAEQDTLRPRRSRTEAARELAERADAPQNFTVRGVLVGLVIGVVICFSNIYFGLQTGWISGMAMPSALIGFGFFRAISSKLKMPFTPVENVLVQTVAGSVGTMPLGCGFVGVIPALEYLLTPEEGGPLDLGIGKLIMWAVGICLFGVVIAVPLRKQVIITEKLKFPTGSATALMIGVLHGEKKEATLVESNDEEEERQPLNQSSGDNQSESGTGQSSENHKRPEESSHGGYGDDWVANIRMLAIAFGGSGLYVRTSRATLRAILSMCLHFWFHRQSAPTSSLKSAISPFSAFH